MVRRLSNVEGNSAGECLRWERPDAGLCPDIGGVEGSSGAAQEDSGVCPCALEIVALMSARWLMSGTLLGYHGDQPRHRDLFLDPSTSDLSFKAAGSARFSEGLARGRSSGLDSAS